MPLALLLAQAEILINNTVLRYYKITNNEAHSLYQTINTYERKPIISFFNMKNSFTENIIRKKVFH
jgi:hypothetical protein